MDTSVSPQQQASNVTLPADIPMPQMAPGIAAPMMPGAMMPGNNTLGLGVICVAVCVFVFVCF